MKIPSMWFAALSIWIASIPAFGQMKDMSVTVSHGVYLDDPAIKEVNTFWVNYLNSHPENITNNNASWNAVEKNRYAKCDLLNSWLLAPYDQMSEYKPTILGIYPEGEYYKIRTMFSRQTAEGFSDPIAITDIFAKKNGSSFELYNALKINTEKWQHRTVGSINFIFPYYHDFDEAAAQRLNRFTDSLAMQLGQKPKHVDYYFANTFEELTRARGFAFIKGEGNAAHPQGYSEVYNNIVTASGAGEWYPHEFVHIYAFAPYPNADVMLHEGLATWLGGSHSHSLDWLARRADSIFRARPEMDVNEILADQRNIAIDYEVGSNYLLGGIIAKAVFEKGGWDMVKKMMTYGSAKGRYAALKNLIGIEPKNAGAYIRSKIAEYGPGFRQAANN